MSAGASLFVLFVVVLLGGWWAVDRIHAHAPLMDSEPSALDALDGVGRCTSRTCTGVGTVTVVDSSATPARRVCASCFERGIRLGWWASWYADRDLTYSEQRALHDDARRITGEAAGGGQA